jgi:hypothetical protein
MSHALSLPTPFPPLQRGAVGGLDPASFIHRREIPLDPPLLKGEENRHFSKVSP